MKNYRINAITLNSLKGYNRFSEVYLKSKKFYSDNLMLVVDYADTSSTQAELGVSVSKKTARNAVTRNRIKRLLRESVRLIIKEYYSKLFFKTIIVSWRKKTQKPGDISLKEVYPEVLELFNKAESFSHENNKTSD